MFFKKAIAPGTVPALFIHIQKTAGSSIVHLARKYYAGSITSYGECWGRSPEQMAHVRFISGHIGFQYAQKLMHGRFTFTLLRDPVERILSMYFFCRARDPGEFVIYRRAHELDLRDFLEAAFSDPWIKKNIWNNQVWQLAHGYAHLDERTIEDFEEMELLDLAMDHLGQFSYVGFTETFSQDAAAISTSLGLPVESQAINMNATHMRPRAEDLPRHVTQLLEELTVLDRQLYEYAQDRFSGGTP